MESLRILVAEDDKLSATLLKALLEAEGHSVCAIAETGEQAIAFAADMHPDAVLMDIYLLDSMTGVEAAQHIVDRYGIPTLVITGATDKGILEQVVESGALGFIKKPVSADELRVNLRILHNFQELSSSLKDSDARCKALYADAPMGIVSCGVDGSIDTCNERFARMLGYGGAEACVSCVNNISNIYADPDDGDAALVKLQQGKWENGQQIALRTCNGGPCSVAGFSSVLTSSSGQLLGYQLMMLDN